MPGSVHAARSPSPCDLLHMRRGHTTTTANPEPVHEQPTRAMPSAGRGELVLGRYRLRRRLGTGGMGVVWEAHDEHLSRDVAVKRVPVEAAQPGDKAGKRAAREAVAAARLGHPAIVALYEAGRDEEGWVLVSELVRGRTLAQLEADGAL